MAANKTLLSSLGLACAGLLGGCAPSDDSGGGSSQLDVSAQNAERLVKAALTVSTIADSLPSTNHFSSTVPTQVNCQSGSVDISPSGSGPADTVTSPSGNALPAPPPDDTVLEFDGCLEDGYTKAGRASGRFLSSAGHRVRWLNLELRHALIEPTQLVGAASFELFFGESLYRIDGVTVTQSSDAFYALGEIDTLTPRSVQLDLQLRISEGGDTGSAQVETPQLLQGTAGMAFDSGIVRITGAGGSRVDAIAQGGGVYRLEIDTDGDGTPEVIRDAVSF